MSQRSLDWLRQLKKDPPSDDLDYADLIRDAVERDDWYSVYMWSKSWVSQGGATAPDAWLGYALSGLLHGQPRTAVHSVDLGLRGWIAEPADRAILYWARGAIVEMKLADPKTAQLDYQAAQAHAPEWLAPIVSSALTSCTHAAGSSRKRKPAIGPAPEYSGAHESTVEPRDGAFTVGEKPQLMETFTALVQA